jgi:hypothetical protein
MSKDIEIKKSTRKGKKYMVKHNNKWIHFGALNMEHYRDSTPLKLYSDKDHNDEDRKKRYLARAGGIKNKAGKKTADDPNSANFYSIRYLWT